jgi:hypothetical protein
MLKYVFVEGEKIPYRVSGQVFGAELEEKLL